MVIERAVHSGNPRDLSVPALEHAQVMSRVANAPAPGEAPMPAPDAPSLLVRNGSEPQYSDRPALRFADEVWTHAQLLDESSRLALVMRERLDWDRPPHVAILLDNTPDYVFALGAAALAGATIVGLNHTRRGEHLAADIDHTDCQMLITESRHLPLLEPIAEAVDLPAGILLSRRFDDEPHAHLSPEFTTEDLSAVVGNVAGSTASYDPGDLDPDPDPDKLWALVFTSGTSSAPKAVRCSQRRLLTTGNRLSMLLGIGPDDVGYVSMPLFHSNSLMVGIAPALVVGACVGLARRFSASRFLDDVRRYGATWFNYTGKPLAYLLSIPERPDDAQTTLRLAYGNEGSPQVVEEVSRRFGIAVIDVFGSTEGAIALDRSGDPPRGSVGRLRPGMAIVGPDGAPRAPARFDAHGRLENAEECVGELVNQQGLGPFEGYYRNDEAMSVTTRNGWYWSGDLAYADRDGWVWFAGRSSDWLRVDGENFPAAPIEAILSRHPAVFMASVYGVPDSDAGDQVMAAVVLRCEHGTGCGQPMCFERFASQLASWLDEQADLSPKWKPRYIRLCKQLPTSATNKVQVRNLVHEKFRLDRVGEDPIFVRARDEPLYHRFTQKDEDLLRRSFDESGRANAWDL